MGIINEDTMTEENVDPVNLTGIRNKYQRKLHSKREKKLEFSAKQTVSSQFLLTEEAGSLERGDELTSNNITQLDIVNAADITSATKHFNLDLPEFGPYKIDYTRNGRHLLMGGRRGHVAAMDWITKRLMFEINVQESVHDVKWLHNETFLAVAQKQFLYIYDNQGVETHCVKRIRNVTHLEFLPFHHLLVALREFRYMTWLDTSLGRIVYETRIEDRNPGSACQNPSNGVMAVGQGNGCVTFWTPKTGKPAAKMFCHPCPITSLTIDQSGQYMVTAGANRTVKVWDLRHGYKCLNFYKVRFPVNNIAASHSRMLAFNMGDMVHVYQDISSPWGRPFMFHRTPRPVSNLQFCPFEDVLGAGHQGGFTSLIIPGSGEPNFDALENNPYQTVKQRREAEVKSLLDKIPADTIAMDETEINKVDRKNLEELMEKKIREMPLSKVPKIDFEPRHKSRSKSTSVNKHKRKQKVQEANKRTTIKEHKQKMDKKATGTSEQASGARENKDRRKKHVLDRFRSKIVK